MSEFNAEFDAPVTEVLVYYADGQVAVQIGPGPEIDFFDDGNPQKLVGVLSPTDGLKFIGSGTRNKPQYVVNPDGSTNGYAPDGVGNFDLVAQYVTDSAGKQRFSYEMAVSYGVRPILSGFLRLMTPRTDGTGEPIVQLSPPGATLVASQPGSVGIGVDEAWHALTPGNGWVNAGGANPPWGMQLLPVGPGLSLFHGALSGGTQTDGTVIGTLATGYYNKVQQTFPAIGYTGAGAVAPRLLIDPTTGNIEIFGISGATAGILQFDGFMIPVS